MTSRFVLPYSVLGSTVLPYKQAQQTIIDVSSQTIDSPPIPIFLRNERMAKVILPTVFTDEDLDKIIKVLMVYKQN